MDFKIHHFDYVKPPDVIPPTPLEINQSDVYYDFCFAVANAIDTICRQEGQLTDPDCLPPWAVGGYYVLYQYWGATKAFGLYDGKPTITYTYSLISEDDHGENKFILNSSQDKITLIRHDEGIWSDALLSYAEYLNS